MQAMVSSEYGSPDVFRLTEVAQPTPKENEVLVEIQAASVNPLDWHYLRGTPFLVRLTGGFFKPKITILGADIAGRVVAVGGGVTLFQPGDEVFGEISQVGLGAFAEYVCVREDAPLVPKPSNTTFAQAAAVPVAGITALQSLRKGQVQAGQRVLINGASGGVGTFTVQIAKALGAEVTGVCSTRNVEMVRSIGADHVIDYTQADFTQTGQHYDVIIDNVGNRTPADLKRVLSLTGHCVIVGFTTMGLLFQAIIMGLWLSKREGQRIGLMGVANSTKADLLVLQEWLTSGKVTPVIDRQYPLREVADAIRYLEEGHVRGKVVINIGQLAP